MLLRAKNYQNQPMFHEAIQKNNSGTFLLRHGVYINQTHRHTSPVSVDLWAWNGCNSRRRKALNKNY